MQSRAEQIVIDSLEIAVVDKGPALLLVVIQQVSAISHASTSTGTVSSAIRTSRTSTVAGGSGSRLAAGLVLAGLGADQVGGVLEVAVDALDGRLDAVFLRSTRAPPSAHTHLNKKKKKEKKKKENPPCGSARPARAP